MKNGSTTELFTRDGEFKVVRGRVAEVTEYYEPIVESHQNNPLIRALPPLKPLDDFIKDLVQKPDWKQRYLADPSHKRAQMPINVKNMFMPFKRHYTLAQGIYNLIQHGYTRRNPLRPTWEQQKLKGECAKFEELNLPSSVESAMLTGMSGLGKSTSVARLIQTCLPQVLLHKEFNGQPFPHPQITWVYLNCPHTASVQMLSSQLLREVDIALQNAGIKADFQKSYVQQHHNPTRLFSGICEVFLQCHVGLVVVDEIQNLTAFKFGGAKNLLNFLVQIQDTLGVPVLLVGNGSINYITGDSIRLARRQNFLENPNWGRLKQNSDEWNEFINALWQYQYTIPETPWRAELSDEIYLHSAGVPDIATDLFKLCQTMAINENMQRKEPEIITLEIIRNASKSLAPDTRRFVRALLKPDFMTLGGFEDLHISDFDNGEYTDEELDQYGEVMAEARRKKERAKKRESIRDGMKVVGD